MPFAAAALTMALAAAEPATCPDASPCATDRAETACAAGDHEGCADLVDGFAGNGDRTRPTRNQAGAALRALEGICERVAMACSYAAMYHGRGIRGIATPDTAAARRFVERGCAAGAPRLCDEARWASSPALTPEEIAAVLERVVRSLHSRAPREDRAHVWCLAVDDGTPSRDSEGSDPSMVSLGRLSDIPVRPASWCRLRKEGTIVAVNVKQPHAFPFSAEPMLNITWYRWNGAVYSGSLLALTMGPVQPARLQSAADARGERRRIDAVVKRFASAWNASGEEPVPPIQGLPAREVREHTRLVVRREAAQVQPDAPYGVAATVRADIRGNFQPGAGKTWPVEPWKQSEASAPVLIVLERTSGWWRGGEWRVSGVLGPWGPKLRMYE